MASRVFCAAEFGVFVLAGPAERDFHIGRQIGGSPADQLDEVGHQVFHTVTSSQGSVAGCVNAHTSDRWHSYTHSERNRCQ